MEHTVEEERIKAIQTANI